MYQKISESDKKRIIECHRNGDDYVELARHLGIKNKTAYAIIRRYQTTGHVSRPRGGNRRLKVSDAIRRTAVEIIEEHAEFTLEQINSEFKLREPHQPHISISSLYNVLDGEMISMKKLEDVPTERNSSRIKNRRHDFAEWLLQEGVNRRLVYIDEAGFNLHTKRTRGFVCQKCLKKFE